MVRIESVQVSLKTSRSCLRGATRRSFHAAIEQHEQAEAGAVGIFHSGQFENQLFGAIEGQLVDGGFHLMQAHAQGHFS
jgi:hypothetical protein